MTTRQRHIVRALLLVGALGVSLVMAELSLRLIDGYIVFATALRPRRNVPIEPQTAQDADRQYVARVRRAPGVDLNWYFEDRPSYSRYPLEAWQQERFNEYVNDPYPAFFEWNRAYLAGLNLVGLKRRGFTREQIHELRNAYRLMFAQEGTFQERLADVAELFANNQEVMDIVNFVRAGGNRPLCMPNRESRTESA